MSSLADCFSKAGKALSGQDKAGIESIVADGLTETEAVDQYLSQLDAEIDQILDQVEAAGGEVARLVQPARNELGLRLFQNPSKPRGTIRS